MLSRFKSNMRFGGFVGRTAKGAFPLRFNNVYDIVCLKPDGSVRWQERTHNLLVTEGLVDVMAKYWKGSSYTAGHFVGLLGDESGISAGDTGAAITNSGSANGWDENVDYDEATRGALTASLGTPSSADPSVLTHASPVTFTMNASFTVGGCFICTLNTKSPGSQSGNVLIGAAAFTGGDKTGSSGDTINVTASLSVGN